MAEKYTDEGFLTDRLETAPNGQQETVINYPLPKRTRISPAFLLHGWDNPFLEVDATVTFKAKNGTATYRLVGGGGPGKTFEAVLEHDDVHE
jgi:hypothetical protein